MEGLGGRVVRMSPDRGADVAGLGFDLAASPFQHLFNLFLKLNSPQDVLTMVPP